MECKKEYLHDVLEGIFETVTLKTKEGEVLYTNKSSVIQDWSDKEREERLFLDSNINELLEVHIVNNILHDRLIHIGLHQKYSKMQSFNNQYLMLSEVGADISMNREELDGRLRRAQLKEKYSRIYFESKPCLSYIYNATKHTYKRNKAWSDLLGYEMHELEQMELVDIIHVEDRNKYKHLIAMVDPNFQAIIRFRDKRGYYKGLNCAATSIEYLGNKVYIIDVQHCVVQNKLKEKNTQLEERVKTEKSKNQFFSTISHEFKTPLNIVLTSTTLIKSLLEETALQNDALFNSYLKVIENRSNKILQITNNLVDLTRLDIDEYKLNCKYYNIVEVVEDILMYAIEYIEVHYNKKLNIIFDTDVEEKIVWCDDKQIERIILITLRRLIEVDFDEEYEIKVYDKGAMIEVELISNKSIFTENEYEYIQDGRIEMDFTHEHYNIEIGVRIAKKLILLHNGKIEIVRTAGKGKTRVTIPACQRKRSYVKREACEAYHKELCRIELSDLKNIKMPLF